jgi:hypothetical protein
VKRHSFDPVSFLFGAAFIALATIALVTNHHIGIHWVTWSAAGLLIITGLAMVTGSRSRAKDDDR